MIFKNTLILLFFSCCMLPTSGLYNQSLDYKPNELLIKWTATSTPNQRAIFRATAKTKAFRSFPNLDIELWTLEETNTALLELVDKYSKHSVIDFVEPNYLYYANEIIPSDPKFSEQWNISNIGQTGGRTNADIGATNAWDIQRESPSVKVAIIDTGIDWTHADLVDNIWQNRAEDADGDGHVLEKINGKWVFDPGDENGIDDDGNGYIDDFIGWDFANDDNNPMDDHFHGTHVAGIVGAKGNDGVGITGVTWTVQMAALKFLDNNSLGSTAAALAAFNYAVTMEMDISNNSWGGPSFSTALYNAIQQAANQNHLVIAAAGNEGNNTAQKPEYPAAFDLGNIISVANTNHQDQLSTTSNYGVASVDVAAPGTRILSCFPNNSYSTISGTSMATPHVTGACALLLEQQPNSSYGSVKTKLINSVDVLPALNGKTVSGGRLNVCKLLGGCTNGKVACAYADSLVLVALYNATNGPNWTTTWDLNKPMNTWSGIITNSRGCVSNIYLADNNLTGNLPSTLGDLTNLESLYLNNNALTGRIPAKLSNLSKLKELYLNFNQLTGSIPSELGQLSNLLQLDIDDNQLTGSIPSELGNLLALEFFNSNDNQLTGAIPKELGKLSNLGYLYFRGNELENSIPPELGNLSKLQLLDLSHNQLTGNIPPELGQLVDLLDLRLNNNQLTGCFPPNFASFCGIYPDFTGNTGLPDNGNFVDFCDKKVGSCSCSSVSDSLVLVNLYTANIGVNWINKWELTTPMASWHGINTNNEGCVSSIDLSNNNLVGNPLIDLTYLTGLERLKLQNNHLSGCFPAGFTTLCALDYDFSNNPDLPNNGDFAAFCGNEIGSCIHCAESDSLALVALYNATNGANWSDPWVLTQPMNTWSGIITNEHGCVTYLSLAELTGTIPSAIGQLAHLEELYLSNSLTGSIPKELGKLSNLTHLSLAFNQLTGSIPPELGYLYKMKDFDLEANQLTGSIPTSLSYLSKLNELDLEDNQLTGTIPEVLGDLSNLKALYLNGNQLTANIPAALSNLNNLEILMLHGNQLSGNIPTEIGDLANLTSLSLANNQLTGSIPPKLSNLSKLTSLDLSSNQLSGCFPQNFTTFCDIFPSFYDNPSLPHGGDFNKFCTEGGTVCSEQSFVWPGDANNDGVVNSKDILYWGLSKNNTGPSRPNASPNWLAQSSVDWSKTINTINGKYQDSDGNGIVNTQDLSVIYSNYGQVHATNLAAANFTNGITYRIVPQGFQGDATFKYDIYVAQSGEPISTHGLSFLVTINEVDVVNATFDFSNSCLDPDEHKDIFNAATNTLDVVLTRTDKTNQVCNTLIGSLLVTMTDIDIGESIQIDIEQGNRISALGELKGVASTSIYDTYTEFGASSNSFLPAVYVNHEECDKLGTATIEIAGGTPPYQIQWSTGATTESISGLLAGTYMVSAQDANGLSANYTVKIKKQYLPAYDENGDLIKCNPAATCTPTLNFRNTIPTGTHQVATTITASGTIAADSEVIFKAGESITLTAGFAAAAGSNFLATIEGCTSSQLQKNNSPSNPSANTITPSVFKEQEQLALTIIPNPLREQTVIDYQLPASTSVQLLVSDMQGRPVRMLLNGVNQEKGQQQIPFWVGDLAKGIYFVSLKTDQYMVTKKIVVLE